MARSKNLRRFSSARAALPVEHEVPSGILHVQRRNVGHVAGHDELLVAGAQLVAGVTGGVPRRRHGAHARHHFLVAFELLDVLPAGEYGLDALGRAARDRRIGPELVLGRRNVDFRVREDRRVGILGHQAGDVIGMEMGHDDGRDLGRVDARPPSTSRFSRSGRPSASAGRPCRSRTARGCPATVIAVTVKVIGTCASVRPAALSAALVSSSDAFLMKPRVVCLLPDAVVHLDDFDIADLEFDDVSRRAA